MPLKDPVKRREYQKLNVRRWVANNRDKARAYNTEWKRKWRADNPERNRGIKKKSWHLHGEENRAKHKARHKRDMADPVKAARKREYGRKWKEANPEKAKASIANWNKNNHERVKLYGKRYSAYRRHRVGTFTHDQWYARVAFYGWCCAYCLIGLTEKTLTIDHIIPIIKGGTNWASNLAPACRKCNVRKNRNRLLPVWIRK